MEELRTTTHNGRHGEKGVYNPKHNDRNYDYRNRSANIDPDRTRENRYIIYDENGAEQEYGQDEVDRGIISEDQHEHEMYKKMFPEYIWNKQESLRNSHHRVMGDDEIADSYRGGEKFCPEETLLYIGNSKNTEAPELARISNAEFWEMAKEYMQRVMAAYPCVKYLDAQLHLDEAGARHVHARRVWVSHDKGYARVCQTAALKEMGIEPPKKVMSRDEYEKAIAEEGLTKGEIARLPKSATDQYNNRKMTFTAKTREMWVEVCREHGLSPELTPRDPSRSGLAQRDYIFEQQKEKLQEQEQILAEKEAAIEEKDKKIGELTRKLSEEESHRLEKNRGIRSALLGGTATVDIQAEQAQKLVNGMLTDKALDAREEELTQRERTLDERAEELLAMEKNISKEVEKKVEERLPARIREVEAYIPQIDALTEREKKVSAREKKLEREREELEAYKETYRERADRMLEIIKEERHKIVDRMLEKLPELEKRIVSEFIAMVERVMERVARAMDFIERLGIRVSEEEIIEQKIDEVMAPAEEKDLIKEEDEICHEL